jgi:phenylacetate-CoA ligase
MLRNILGRRLEPSLLKIIQNKKLRALIRHSYDYVPYYHDLMKSVNVTPEDIKTIDDLNKIPVTTNNDLVDLPLEHRIASDINLNDCWRSRTSGTTGISLTVYFDLRARLLNLILIARCQLERGDRLTNKQIMVGSGWLDEGLPFQRIGIFRAKRVSQLDDVKAQIGQIKEFDPRTMQSSASCTLDLANEVIEGKIKGIDIQQIFSTGEWLDGLTRKKAMEAFDADIFDVYGAIEVGRIYNECPKHYGNNVESEAVIIEVTRNHEILDSGEEGEITVTNLNNIAMPFIRYNLQDIGQLHGNDCACGSCLPIMSLKEGRAKDRLIIPSGRIISSIMLITEMRYIEGIRQFQVIQEEIDRYEVRLVKGLGYKEDIHSEIECRLRKVLGNVRIEISMVPFIPKGRTGKTRQFISNMPMNLTSSSL